MDRRRGEGRAGFWNADPPGDQVRREGEQAGGGRKGSDLRPTLRLPYLTGWGDNAAMCQRTFSSSPRACPPHPPPQARHPALPSIPETEPEGLRTLGTYWVQACASSETACGRSEPNCAGGGASFGVQ